jgi:flagellar hook protein FlgE
MSLYGSLFSGVAGLSAQSRAMGMISDNVANVNTPAYKASLPQFSSLVTGRTGPNSYSPGGVRAITGQSVGVQGLIQGTASPTDSAISGPGFFVVNSAPDAAGQQLYTRAGSFTPDHLGNLRTASGFYVQGWALVTAHPPGS